MAKEDLSKRQEFMTERMNTKMKKKTVVLSMTLYGLQRWTLGRDEIRRLEV